VSTEKSCSNTQWKWWKNEGNRKKKLLFVQPRTNRRKKLMTSRKDILGLGSRHSHWQFSLHFIPCRRFLLKPKYAVKINVKKEIPWSRFEPVAVYSHYRPIASVLTNLTIDHESLKPKIRYDSIWIIFYWKKVWTKYWKPSKNNLTWEKIKTTIPFNWTAFTKRSIITKVI